MEKLKCCVQNKKYFELTYLRNLLFENGFTSIFNPENL